MSDVQPWFDETLLGRRRERKLKQQPSSAHATTTTTSNKGKHERRALSALNQNTLSNRDIAFRRKLPPWKIAAQKKKEQEQEKDQRSTLTSEEHRKQPPKRSLKAYLTNKASPSTSPTLVNTQQTAEQNAALKSSIEPGKVSAALRAIARSLRTSGASSAEGSRRSSCEDGKAATQDNSDAQSSCSPSSAPTHALASFSGRKQNQRRPSYPSNKKPPQSSTISSSPTAGAANGKPVAFHRSANAMTGEEADDLVALFDASLKTPSPKPQHSTTDNSDNAPQASRVQAASTARKPAATAFGRKPQHDRVKGCRAGDGTIAQERAIKFKEHGTFHRTDRRAIPPKDRGAGSHSRGVSRAFKGEHRHHSHHHRHHHPTHQHHNRNSSTKTSNHISSSSDNERLRHGDDHHCQYHRQQHQRNGHAAIHHKQKHQQVPSHKQTLAANSTKRPGKEAPSFPSKGHEARRQRRHPRPEVGLLHRLGMLDSPEVSVLDTESTCRGAGVRASKDAAVEKACTRRDRVEGGAGSKAGDSNANSVKAKQGAHIEYEEGKHEEASSGLEAKEEDDKQVNEDDRAVSVEEPQTKQEEEEQPPRDQPWKKEDEERQSSKCAIATEAAANTRAAAAAAEYSAVATDDEQDCIEPLNAEADVGEADDAASDHSGCVGAEALSDSSEAEVSDESEEEDQAGDEQLKQNANEELKEQVVDEEEEEEEEVVEEEEEEEVDYEEVEVKVEVEEKEEVVEQEKDRGAEVKEGECQNDDIGSGIATLSIDSSCTKSGTGSKGDEDERVDQQRAPTTSSSAGSSTLSADEKDEPAEAVTAILQLCGLENPCLFSEAFGGKSALEACVKVGEGSYGEVFALTPTILADASEECRVTWQEALDHGVAFKLMPVDGNTPINGGLPKRTGEMVSEIACTLLLSAVSAGLCIEDASGQVTLQLPTFIRTHRLCLCQGAMPGPLLDKWDAFLHNDSAFVQSPVPFLLLLLLCGISLSRRTRRV